MRSRRRVDSVLRSTSCALACSGEMYAGVPSTETDSEGVFCAHAQLRDSEVEELHEVPVTLLYEEHIFRFDVAVNDALSCTRFERVRELIEDVDSESLVFEHPRAAPGTRRAFLPSSHSMTK